MASDLSSADRRGLLPRSLHRRTLSTAVLAIATLGAGVLVLAGGDAAGQASTLSAPPTTDRFTHPRPLATPAPKASARPPARDPFRPLYTVPVPATGTSTGTTPTGETHVGAMPIGTMPVGTMPTGTSGGSGSPTGSGIPTFVFPGSGSGGSGSGQVPDVSTPTVPPVERRPLVLTGVEITGDSSVALFMLDGSPVRVPVAGSFGPADELLLLSVQQGPRVGQWTAVVKLRTGTPFDVVTGTPASVPAV